MVVIDDVMKMIKTNDCGCVTVTGSDDVEQLPPTPPGSCSEDSEESRSPKGSAPSSPQQQRLQWRQPAVAYYSTFQPTAAVIWLSQPCVCLCSLAVKCPQCVQYMNGYQRGRHSTPSLVG